MTVGEAPFRHLLTDADYPPATTLALIDRAAELKRRRRAPGGADLTGRSIAILFEKPSTRTRAAFEVGAHELGASTSYIDPASSHLGVSESAEDTARVLGRMYDGIAFRGFAQSTVDTLARASGVPVWNALTDLWHPTQALADLMTMREHSRKPLDSLVVCFVGDARDNVSNSLMVAGASCGLDVRIAAPAALQPDAMVVGIARERAAGRGAITVTDDVDAAIRGADVIYTDVWVSMGEPADEWAERVRMLTPYRVTERMLESTGNPETRFMHCLPSIHDASSTLGREILDRYGLAGAEVEDAAFRSARSVVFDQAENRLHTIKAVMSAALGADAR